MAKRYVSVSIEGHSVSVVETALAGVVGPGLSAWRSGHFCGVHIDVADMTSALAYADSVATDARATDAPVVDIDVYARADLDVHGLQLAIARTLAAGLTEVLKAAATVTSNDEIVARYEGGAIVDSRRQETAPRGP